MPDPTTLPHLVRFGIYEVNLRAGEVRRDGAKIKLQEQPFKVLAMLLERPPRVFSDLSHGARERGSDDRQRPAKRGPLSL